MDTEPAGVDSANQPKPSDKHDLGMDLGVAAITTILMFEVKIHAELHEDCFSVEMISGNSRTSRRKPQWLTTRI